MNFLRGDINDGDYDDDDDDDDKTMGGLRHEQ